MVSGRTDLRANPLAGSGPAALKVLVAGGFGVGKTTFVGSVSEIPPLSTEQQMSDSSERVDIGAVVPEKRTTTVALDFGRLTVGEDLVLYLFGTPGQSRFWFMWDELASGAVGALILVDLRRVSACFPAVDFFESRGLPFVLAVNQFPHAGDYDDDSITDALCVGHDYPVVRLDARDGTAARQGLARLVEHALAWSPSA